MDFLVHTVKLKPIIKAQISGKLVTSGIIDVATASVHSEKTQAKKWSMIIIINFIIGFSFTVWTKKSAKKVRKQVTECLQNLYQSVAIHQKYVLLVLL